MSIELSCLNFFRGPIIIIDMTVVFFLLMYKVATITSRRHGKVEVRGKFQ